MLKVFDNIREAANDIYGPAAERKSDFFRDIAGSRFMRVAEDMAREANLPYELLMNVYDKAIIEVENRPPEGDLRGKFLAGLEFRLMKSRISASTRINCVPRSIPRST